MEEDFEEEFSKTGDVTFDDGVYILANRRCWISRHLEYRVSYVPQIDFIYDEKIGKQAIKAWFGDSKVYKVEQDAIDEAMRLIETIEEPTEHGLGVIYKWEDITFKKLIGG